MEYIRVVKDQNLLFNFLNTILIYRYRKLHTVNNDTIYGYWLP
jgi:hypothetical protein